MKTTINLILILLISLNSFSKEKIYSCEKWQVIDLEFEAKIKSDNPFAIQFGAELISESGKTMNIPGFYNDNNIWVIRFCPPDEGNWTFKTYSSESKLTGLTGTISVSANTKPDEHGPIVISKTDKQKFEYADGTPYFLLAFELDWLFALDVENKNGIPRTEEIVGEIAKNGFNQVVMNVYAYDAMWGDHENLKPEHNFAKPKVFPYAGTNENPDYSTLNVDFFKHLDRVMKELNEQEVISHLMIYVWNKKVKWPEPESVADNLYFDYVVKRYQAFPNLIWDISKEALAYGRDDMNYITRRIDRLRKMDGHGRLLSVHDYAYCRAFPGKVDFISIQNWNANIYNVMKDVVERHKNQPIFNIEHGGYERTMPYSTFDGAYNDAAACLDRNYKCIFAGSYSTYYWQNTSWYEVVYNPSALPDEQQPKFNWYKNLTQLFTDYDFRNYQPANASHAYCLYNNKDTYMFYLTRDMIALNGMVPGVKNKIVKIKWFNPFTGNYIDGERTFNGVWIGVDKPKEVNSPFCVAILEVQN